MNNECWGTVGDAGFSLESVIGRMRIGVVRGQLWLHEDLPPHLLAFHHICIFSSRWHFFFEIIMEIKGEV